VDWRRDCAARGEAAVLFCYALGKAQRVWPNDAFEDQPALLHGPSPPESRVYREAGIPMLDTRLVAEEAKGADFAGQLVIAPALGRGQPVDEALPPRAIGLRSGWMRIRATGGGATTTAASSFRPRRLARLFRTVRETGARRVIATHGNTDAIIGVARAGHRGRSVPHRLRRRRMSRADGVTYGAAAVERDRPAKPGPPAHEAVRLPLRDWTRARPRSTSAPP
jgi:hypothetical protein